MTPATQPKYDQPWLVRKQKKSVTDTAHSFYKAGMGLIVQNTANAYAVTKRISDRFQNKLDGKAELGSSAASGAKDMRIDSDDIHYHVHSPTTSGGSGGALMKGLLGAGLLATGIGAPLGGWMIAQALLKPAIEKVITQPGINRDADVSATATIEMPE